MKRTKPIASGYAGLLAMLPALQARGVLQWFETDLTHHDRVVISARPTEAFVWFAHKSGSYLAFARDLELDRKARVVLSIPDDWTGRNDPHTQVAFVVFDGRDAQEVTADEWRAAVRRYSRNGSRGGSLVMNEAGRMVENDWCDDE